MSPTLLYPEHIAAVEEQIRRTFPVAVITWDTRMSPFMLAVTVDGALVRAFIEPESLAARGEVYDAFMRRIAELVVDSTAAASHHSSPDNGFGKKIGVNAPLSAAKVQSTH